MENIEQILINLDINIPEEKKTQLLEQINKNYVSIEEYKSCKDQQEWYKKALYKERKQNRHNSL